MSLPEPIDYGYYRVASAVPRVNVADVDANVQEIIRIITLAASRGAQLLALPELCVTGYTCADLFGNELLLNAAEAAVATTAHATRGSKLLVFVGCPLRTCGHLLNCAVALQNGEVLGVVPKTYLPNYKEYYEKRWFTSANLLTDAHEIAVNGQRVPFGTDLIFEAGRAKVAVEICEDLWVPVPPSSVYALNGANVIVNLSASNELIGKHDYLVDMIKHHSSHSIVAYVYASAGYGESTTDLVFAGNAIIAERGTLLKSSERFSTKPQLETADVDIEAIDNERQVNGSFGDNRLKFTMPVRHIAVEWGGAVDYDQEAPQRPISRTPFVPDGEGKINERCTEIVNIQTQGLMRRLAFTRCKALVVGISGGLDSTLALMIAVRVFDALGLDRKGIYGITMPGFGTTGRTHHNALRLMKALGVNTREISIAAAVKQHFADIGQDINCHDVTYENGQARERTQILMDFANKVGGMVLGTGDLSELALGWATYNGDHMSMYNVNSDIPKTLAKYLVMWFAGPNDNNSTPQSIAIHETLLDVLHTPISPELTPADDKGNIKQKTEDLIGPYELHDFFLYNMLRHGYAPRKLFMLATHAFAGEYDKATIKRWLTKFVWRFFSQQFKRSCLPDGPKVGNVSLSPRGDWRMPSDAAAALWAKECESLPTD